MEEGETVGWANVFSTLGNTQHASGIHATRNEARKLAYGETFVTTARLVVDNGEASPRVLELLRANNAEVERRRAAEAEVRRLTALLLNVTGIDAPSEVFTTPAPASKGGDMSVQCTFKRLEDGAVELIKVDSVDPTRYGAPDSITQKNPIYQTLTNKE